MAFLYFFFFLPLESESDEEEELDELEGDDGGPAALKTPGRIGFVKERAATPEASLLSPFAPTLAAPEALLA